MENESNQSELQDGAEEEILHYYVPHIDNGYILDFAAKHGNASTARMLIDLPLCHIDDERRMTSCLSKLKSKREKLRKNKSTEGLTLFQQFKDVEFTFPADLETERLIACSIHIILIPIISIFV